MTAVCLRYVGSGALRLSAGGLVAALLMASANVCLATQVPVPWLAAGLAGQIDQNREPQVSEAAGQWDSLSQIVLRNRQHATALKGVERRLQTGNLAEAFQYLQWILDEEADSFYWDEERRQLITVRQAAERIMRSLPPASRRFHQGIYGPAAERLLAEARTTADPGRFRQVVRSHWFTPAGQEAALWLAAYWADRGKYELAARMWEALLNEPQHSGRLNAEQRAKAVMALRLAGRDPRGELNSGASDAAQGVIQVAGRTVDQAHWQEIEALRSAVSSSGDNWRMPLGNARRNQSLSGSSPLLRADWSESLSGSDRKLDAVIRFWEEQQTSEYRPIAIASFPVAVGSTVILRDHHGIRACDLKTGERLWQHGCETSLAGMVREIGAQALMQREDPAAGRPGLDAQEVFFGNAVLGMLSSDGQRVYAVDCVSLEPQMRSRRSGRRVYLDSAAEQADCNRLVALQVSGARSGKPRVAWSIGGAWGTTEELTGFYFHGAPLPVDGQLFIIGESERQISLLALDAGTGRLLWSQGLAYIDAPPLPDSVRDLLPCSPSYSQGIVVCPSPMGALFGVDATDGSLLWAYDCISDRTQNRFQLPYLSARATRGHPGFPDLPQIQEDRVVCLPRYSDFLHCVQLTTGRLLWRAPRGDAEYVAAVTDDAVLVVGRESCRAVSLGAGELLWERAVGLPSGRGVRLGEHYLVPLQEGRVATLEIRTGEERGYSLSPAEFTPGNLIAHGERIVSVGTRHVAVYPQAEALLQDVEAELAGNALPNRSILAAELHLALGDLAAAKQELSHALRAASGPERSRAEQLQRETLYLELGSGQGEEDVLLRELDVLAQTPEDRARYLVWAAERALAHRDASALAEAISELTWLEQTEPIPDPQNASHVLSATTWVRRFFRRAEQEFGFAEREVLLSNLGIQQQMALAEDTIERLGRFSAAHPDRPESEAVRLRLAEHLDAAGRLQEAEFQLLQNAASRNIAVAADASRMLVALWDRAGRHHAAGALLKRLPSDRANAPPAGRHATAADDALRAGTPGGLTDEAYRRSRPVGWEVSSVQIMEDPAPSIGIAIHPWSDRSREWSDSALLSPAYNGRVERLAAFRDDSLDLLLRGTGVEKELAVVEQTSGSLLASMPCFHSGVLASAAVGHFLPLSTPASIRGVSLLQLGEGEPLWQRTAAELGLRTELVNLGPAGPTFCIIQARQQLVALDPGTGRVLWQRNDLEDNSGFASDSRLGLFGDEHVLVVFGRDRRSYTLYETATGEILRRGTVNVNQRQTREAFGRKLFHVTDSLPDKRMRIWDPLEDRMLLDERAGDRILYSRTPEDELALILADQRLRVIDVENNEVVLESSLEGEISPTSKQIRVFSRAGRYFLNIESTNYRTPSATHTTNHAGTEGVVLPSTDLRDDFYALERETGKLLWKRRLPARTLLHIPHCELPFLVLVSQVRERPPTSKRTLTMEVIDSGSGQTIGYRDNLQWDRIVRSSCDPAAGRLQLFGLQSRIDLDFGPRWQNLRPMNPYEFQ